MGDHDLDTTNGFLLLIALACFAVAARGIFKWYSIRRADRNASKARKEAFDRMVAQREILQLQRQLSHEQRERESLCKLVLHLALKVDYLEHQRHAVERRRVAS